MVRLTELLSAAALVGCLAGCRSADQVLIADLLERYAKRAGTPYEWKAGHLRHSHYQLIRAELLGSSEGPWEELRAKLRKLDADIRLGEEDWPQPVTLNLPQAPVPPVIDGKLEEAAWKNALTFRGEYPLNSRKHQALPSVWKLMYDKEFLYFAVDFDDGDLRINRDRLYWGDAVELFIMPDPRLHTYAEIVVAPDASHYQKWATTSVGEPFMIEHYEPASLMTAAAERPGGYRIEGRIGFRDLPGYLLGNPAEPGQTLRVMMIRMNLDGDELSSSVPTPFLYDGHNTFGYMTLVLQ